jgi:type IV conjugative transfer system protein TraL
MLFDKMKNQQVVLKHLNSPIRILSFSVGDLAAYLSPFFLGSLLDSLVVIPVSGLLLIFLSKRLLKTLPKFYLVRFFYWSLPTKSVNRMFKSSFPNSNKRYWTR